MRLHIVLILKNSLNGIRKNNYMNKKICVIGAGSWGKNHIRILDRKLIEYARGLSSFSSNEILKIQGQHSKKISDLI